MSTHFEGMGAKWSPLLDDPHTEAPQMGLLAAQQGGTRPCWQTKTSKRETMLMAWPKDAHLRGAVTVDGVPGNQLSPVAVFPLMEGLPNDMTVKEVVPWKNGVEAYVSACRNEEGRPLVFHAPLYFRDSVALIPEVRHTFSLAGLVRGLRRALLDEMTIADGPRYEAFAAEWLENNPGSTRLDVPQLTVPLKGARVLMPDEFLGDYQLRAPISAVEETTFGEDTVYMLRVELGLDTPEPLFLMLYAPEKVCNGLKPQEGDEIDALFWLQGRIMD